jgi:FtsZ-binding cell division protein ZapB
MNHLLEALEERVAAASALIGRLRSEVARLEAETASPTPLVPEEADAADAADAAEAVRALREEVARLQAERAVVRDRIRGLIKEIDAVTW